MNEERSPAEPFIAPQVAKALEQTQVGKYHTNSGHGFAAEDANSLADRWRGKRVQPVGTSNELNGADRIAGGIRIQTKYCQTARLTIGEAFDAKGAYQYEGQAFEVPKDQYKECLRLMQERIADGKVPNITDPNDAAKIIKQGDVTYRQARNIAKPGTVDAILFDAKSQTITTTYAFGLSFVIQLARCKWNGCKTGDAIKSAIASGLASGATTLITGVITAQVLRSNAAAVAAVAAQHGVRVIASSTAGRTAIQSIARASLGKAVYGAAAVNHVAKLLRTNLITSAVVVVVTSTPDFYRAALARSISWKQFTKNGIVTISGVGGGVGGWMVGAGVGAAVGSLLPGPGTVIGGVVGGLAGALGGGLLVSWGAKAGMDQLMEDDAQAMLRLLQAAIEQLAEDHLLSEKEIEELAGKVKATVTASWLRSMYQARTTSGSDADRQAFAYEAFDEACLEIAKKREKVAVPPPEEVADVIGQLVEEAVKRAADDSPPSSEDKSIAQDHEPDA
jgi:hypothetical protein